jgi:hypothetical protein
MTVWLRRWHRLRNRVQSVLGAEGDLIMSIAVIMSTTSWIALGVAVVIGIAIVVIQMQKKQ